MVEMNQFGSMPPGSAQVCGRCEALLMDVLDGAASAEDQAFFDGHVASCTGCSQMLADAQRGGAWLEMLRDPRPEPPAALFERILAQTSGITAFAGGSAVMPGRGSQELGAGVTLGVSGAAAYPLQPRVATFPVQMKRARVLPFFAPEAWQRVAQTMLQPRLAMTAAMAFFSIALTLNLTGVHVSALRLSDLKPANLRREFFEANAHVVRYCDNLRVVYELEARTHDLQRSTESDGNGDSPKAPADGKPNGLKDQKDGAPTPQDEPKSGAKTGPGTSRRESMARDGQMVASLPLAGTRMYRDWATDGKNVVTSMDYTKGDPA